MVRSNGPLLLMEAISRYRQVRESLVIGVDHTIASARMTACPGAGRQDAADQVFRGYRELNRPGNVRQLRNEPLVQPRFHKSYSSHAGILPENS